MKPSTTVRATKDKVESRSRTAGSRFELVDST
jgi:hypothetical protein